MKTVVDSNGARERYLGLMSEPTVLHREGEGGDLETVGLVIEPFPFNR